MQGELDYASVNMPQAIKHVLHERSCRHLICQTLNNNYGLCKLANKNYNVGALHVYSVLYSCVCSK